MLENPDSLPMLQSQTTNTNGGSSLSEDCTYESFIYFSSL